VTEDVIHSFWIPRVHGKVDMIPGSDNILTFTVEEPGRYRGQCAEYCGVAHAQMAKFLVAQEPDEFDAWVGSSSRTPPSPTTESQQAGRRPSSSTAAPTVTASPATAPSARSGPT
jgi:cytochrome c oxidase subunit II